MTIRGAAGIVVLAAVALVAPAATASAHQEDAARPAKKHRKKRQKERRDGKLVDERGTVVKISDDLFGIVPDFDTGTRYLPDNLPDDFRQDGLRVVFSGQVGEIPPNVRMAGTPLTLSDIRRLEGGG